MCGRSSGACASAALLVGATLAIWGWPVWQAFLNSLPLTRQIVIEQGETGWHKIQSPFAWVRMWGGAVPLAYAVQAAATRGGDGRGLLADPRRPAEPAQRRRLRGRDALDALCARLRSGRARPRRRLPRRGRRRTGLAALGEEPARSDLGRAAGVADAGRGRARPARPGEHRHPARSGRAPQPQPASRLALAAGPLPSRP